MPDVAPPTDPSEIRRSLEALPRMVPVLLQGITREDLQRAAPGAPVPWAALRTHLASGAVLLGRLSRAAPLVPPPPDAPVSDLVDAFADQRVRLCGWLDQQVAARGPAVWDDVVVGSQERVGPACAALVVGDRALLLQLAAHRNWLKGR